MGRNPSGEKQKLRKGLWSPEEDEKLFNHINTFGVGCWSSVPKQADLQRCGKSCRLRWINYLRPGIKRGSFSQEEENLVISLHKILGNRWSQIASHLPRRTDNEIKNLWNSTIKKKLAKKQGLVDSELSKPEVTPTADTDMGSRLKKFEASSMETSGLSSYNCGSTISVSSSTGENSWLSKSGIETTPNERGKWHGEKNIEDFLQLIHNNCTGIEQEQEHETSRIISGGELNCEYEVGFF